MLEQALPPGFPETRPAMETVLFQYDLSQLPVELLVVDLSSNVILNDRTDSPFIDPEIHLKGLGNIISCHRNPSPSNSDCTASQNEHSV